MPISSERLRRLRAAGLGLATLALGAVSAGAQPSPHAQDAQGWSLPQHSADWPAIAPGRNRAEIAAAIDSGPQLERGRSARALLAEHRKLAAALAGLAPQRRGTVDAYVIALGLDSDPVFGREAREAGKVLARRYDAEGRTLVLAHSDGSGPSALPGGDPEALALALARAAEVMDVREDVLVLYSTGHGSRAGLAYHDGNEGYGIVSPNRLRALLDELGIENRLLILSACYSGVFLAPLASDTTAILTAASATRSSFGCQAENDWTFFGDALVNHALRRPDRLAEAANEARRRIAQWEAAAQLQSSNPQVVFGSKVASWLTPLEARIPRDATQPVGRPARQALQPENE